MIHISAVVIMGTKIDSGSGNCWMIVFFIDQRNYNFQVTCHHFEQSHKAFEMKWTFFFVIIADEMKNKNYHIEEGK